MATLTETTVQTEVTIRLEGAEGETPAVRVVARARSLTAGGEVVRTMSRDITDDLSAGRQAGAADLLADVTARAKAFWQIP